MRQLFRRSPDNADLEAITEAVEILDRCRRGAITDEREAKSRAAYVDLLRRVGKLPEGDGDFYVPQRENVPNSTARHGNGNGSWIVSGRFTEPM